VVGSEHAAETGIVEGRLDRSADFGDCRRDPQNGRDP
jgi:hypothetical protein